MVTVEGVKKKMKKEELQVEAKAIQESITGKQPKKNNAMKYAKIGGALIVGSGLLWGITKLFKKKEPVYSESANYIPAGIQ